MVRRGTMRLMRGLVGPGIGVLVGAGILAGLSPAGAQTMEDLIGVRDAIRAELARPGSGIPPETIAVSNVRTEGDFGTADVQRADLSAPTVFVKRVDGRWQVVLVGAEVSAADCRNAGFPAGSQICSY